jgi:hypothetical protein
VTIFFVGAGVSIEPHFHRRAPTAMSFRKRVVAFAAPFTLAEQLDGDAGLAGAWAKAINRA